MAYIPPHKRTSNSSDVQSPAPASSSLSTHLHQTLTLDHRHGRRRHEKSRQNHPGRIVYGTKSISRWFPSGGAATDMPEGFRLESYPCEPVERKTGSKPLVLSAGDGGAVVDHLDGERPWESIAERVAPDLVTSARSAQDGVDLETQEIRLSFVARVGKIFFHGETSDCLETIKKVAFAGADSRNQLHKSFYTNVPDIYKENIEHVLVPKLGFDFNSEKEYYEIKIYDKCRPESTISCKCRVMKDSGELQVHKTKLNPVRHLVVDISCLYKDLDLRLMLVSKQLLREMKDEETDSISKLIKSAIVDPNVKGGLRWPLGKESVADRYSIIGVWHTRFKIFKCGTMRLKLRRADRFDYKSSTGEVSTEVTMNITGISKQLRHGDFEAGPIKLMIQEAVKLMWINFLTCDHFTNSG